MKRIVWIVMALVVVLSACSGGSVVATVDGLEINEGDVEKLIAEDLTTATPELYAQLIQTLILHEVISEAALDEFEISISSEEIDQGIVALTAQFAQSGGTLEETAAQEGLSLDAVSVIIGDDLTQQAVVEVLSESVPDPSEEDVLAAYTAALQSLTEVCASHILVPTEEEAQVALDRIVGGEPFEDVAAELGTDGTAEVGGDLGCAPASNYVPEFGIATIEADLEVPTGPIESQFGYHVILVRDRTQTALEDIRFDIEATLRQQASATLLSDWVIDVFGGADVTVVEEYGTWELDPFPTVVPPVQ